MRVRIALASFILILLLPATAAGQQVGHLRNAIDTNASFPNSAQTAERHGVVILHAWQQDRLRALKQANPATKVLVYKNLGFMGQGLSSSGYSSSGVPFGEADADHSDWFLKNTEGERFSSWSYRWLFAADVGNPGYQARWADNVIAELTSQGWDGVFMDDTNPTMKYHYTAERVARYPSDASYAAATRSALAAIGPRVRAAGKLAMANIGSWAEYPSIGSDWLQYLDGAMDEMFLKWGNAAGQGYSGRWQAQLDEVKEAERRGKIFLGITHSDLDDAAAARYGYATMLLAGEGRAHFALAHDYTNETWFPEYDYDLGRATAAESRDANGVHRRRFERGLVLVNPTSEAKQVSFGGTYSGSGHANATSATMSATSGLVLHGQGPSGPAPGAASPAVLVTVSGPRRAELRWTSGGRGVTSYRVRRNGKVIALTRMRRFFDKRIRKGRRYRYTVAALRRDGKLLRKSRPARIRLTRRGGRRGAGRGRARRHVRGALGTDEPRGWKRAYVERRVRVGGRLRWRRVTRVVRPHSSMLLAIRVPRRSTVRLVVRATGGRTLHSAAFMALGS